GGQEVVALMASGREVVVDVNGVLASRQPLNREAKRHGVSLGVGRVVSVQVAVLPGPIGKDRMRPIGELVEVDGKRGGQTVLQRLQRQASAGERFCSLPGSPALLTCVGTGGRARVEGRVARHVVACLITGQNVSPPHLVSSDEMGSRTPCWGEC